jgi:hypothetical protein
MNGRLLTPLPQRRLRSRPDDVLNGQIRAKNSFLVLVSIHEGSETRRIEAKEIEERTVLPERIRILRVIHRAICVAEKEEQAGSQILAKASSSFGIHVRREHPTCPPRIIS